jgi:hypothetical protein
MSNPTQKNTLPLQTKIALRELKPTARALNNREEVIAAHWAKLFESSSEILKEGMLQGADLIRARYPLGQANFETWLVRECPMIPPWRARTYIKEVTRYSEANCEQIELFDQGTVLEGLHRLCAKPKSLQPDAETNGARERPAYLEGLQLWTRFAKITLKHPLKQWPNEGKEKLRELFEPLAIELWPDKFK